MHPQSLYPETKQVLDKIKVLPLLNGFYLAGGTALALQLGHRKSIDLDFFTGEFPKRELILQELKPLSPVIAAQAEGTIDTLIDNVKVSFLSYNYPLLDEKPEFEGVKLASVIDIACMKLTAISSRGSKKDFVDMCEILKNRSLAEVFTAFEKKYQGIEYQKLHILKSLVYFDDADKDPDPDYIESTDWGSVKKIMSEKVKSYFSVNPAST